MSIGINVIYVNDINTQKRKAMSVLQHLSPNMIMAGITE